MRELPAQHLQYQHKRPTIAYFPGSITIPYFMTLWRGIVDAAEAARVNLISVEGRKLHSSYESDIQSNILYELIHSGNIDGLLIQDAVGHFASPEALKNFAQRYSPLPVISLGMNLPGIPRILYEEFQSMRSAVTHLIEVHNLRRIAFIQGPVQADSSRERFRGYCDALAANNLSVEPALITPGDYTQTAGEQAIHLLLNERKVKFEAVVAANDEMAFGAMKALRSHEMDVPGDVAVIGFDDIEEAVVSMPPLTTLRAPRYELGKQAVSMLLAQLEGEVIPDEIVLPAGFMVRQSCGCFSSAVSRVVIDPGKIPETGLEVVLTTHRALILSGMEKDAGESSKNLSDDWAERLLEAFVTEITGDVPGLLLRRLNEALHEGIITGREVFAWQGAISALRRQVLPYLSGERLLHAIDLWEQAQVLIGEAAIQSQAYQIIQVEEQTQMLGEIGAALITTFDLEGLMNVLAERLPGQGIPGCYLALYEEPYQYPQSAPEWSRLILAYNRQGRIALEPEGVRFRSRELLPRGIYPEGEPFSFIVEPLYFQKDQLGFVLFEVGPRDGNFYDSLRRDISSALQGALLVKQMQEHAAEIARQKYILDTFMESVPDAIYFKDRESRITRVNQAFARLFKLESTDAAVGKTDFDFFPDEVAQPKHDQEQEIIRSGLPLVRMEDPDVDGNWALSSKMPLRDENGEIIGTFGISRDITSIKLAQQALANQTRQLLTVADVTTATSTLLDTDDLLQQVVDLTRERFGLYHAHIYLLNERGDTLELAASSGEAGREMVAQHWHIPLDDEESVVANAVRTRQGVIVNDVRRAANQVRNPFLLDVRSELAVPLIMGHRVLGALDVQSEAVDYFTDDDLWIQSTLAGQVAVALQNARLFTETTRAREEAEQAKREIESVNKTLEAQIWRTTGLAQLNDRMRGEQDIQSLAQHTVRQLCQYINAQVGALYVAENGYLNLTGSYAYNSDLTRCFRFGEGLVGQAATEQKPVIIASDAVSSGSITLRSALGEIVLRSIMVFPFVYESETVGVIEMGTLNKFTQQQMDFIQAALDSIAIAFNTAQARTRINELLTETQQQAEEMQVQSEELRAANEELEAHTRNLRASEVLLRDKQSALDKQNQELKAAHRELERKAEELALASKYKSEFLANMSHELRTPLNSLLILARMLSDNEAGNLTGEQVESAQIIYSGGMDLLNLINDILDLSKIESGKMVFNFDTTLFRDVISIVNAQFTYIAQEKGLSFNVRLDDNIPVSIVTDQQRVAQIVKNLLSNAFKFTGEGSVNLHIFRPRADIILPQNGLDPAEAIAISVSDTGIGMTPDQLSIIFEAFQQADGSTSRQYGGTGLGLSISRELANNLGGQITVESEYGRGSCFTLYLPINRTIDRKGEQAEVRASKTFSLKSLETIDDRYDMRTDDRIVLIIEDDARFARVVYDYAHKRNFKCLIAPTGGMGLELVRTYQPSAIILDLYLPDIGGLEVLDILKKNPATRDIPVQVMSVEESTLNVYEKGALEYVAKPISLEQLEASFQKIEQVISQKIRSLLLVEDDANSRRSIQTLLRGEDLKISGAESGQEALDLLMTWHFDCMILDLKLPDMSGFEVLEKMHSDDRVFRCPVIVYTGHDLTLEETQKLTPYTSTVIMKGNNSVERLLDETAFFLNRLAERLPVIEENTAQQLSNDMFRGKKVLIVDDDLRNSFALSKLLSEREMIVKLAQNGQKALDMLTVDPTIDLILVDIMMPVMDGFETIRHIRAQQRFKNLPVLAVTAKAMKGDHEKCFEAGASDYLSKPIDLDKLFAMLHEWLCQEN